MRYNVLDLMRFLAALSVVLFHYTYNTIEPNSAFTGLSEYTKFGFLGVPLFFTISGFVICASALNRTPAEFAISRVTRLYPTVFCCLTITVLIEQIVTIGKNDLTLYQYFSNLTLLNEYLGADYIDGSYWTLLVELKFYFCVLLLLAFGVFEKFKIWLTIWSIMNVSFLVFGQPFFMGWFISPEYSAFFIAGVTFFLATKYGYNNYYIGLLITSLIVALIQVQDQIKAFVADSTQLDYHISVVFIFSFFALFLMISLNKIRLKPSKVLLTMGGMTYPLYLLHSQAGKVINEGLAEFGYMESYPALILIILLMLFLAYEVHVHIEKRFANSVKVYLFALLAKIQGGQDGKRYKNFDQPTEIIAERNTERVKNIPL